jgi:hypothetical protein
MATVNLGSIKFKWKGTYSGATAYTVDDVVEYNGSSYICILASTGNLPTNATYFEQMSSAGTNGTNGTDLGTTLTTQGDLVYRDGSGLARLGAGTAGQVLQTGGAGANPSWGTVSSDFVKLATAQASASSYVTFNGYFSSTYDTYKVVAYDVQMSATDSRLTIQLAYGGGYTYVTSDYGTLTQGGYTDYSTVDGTWSSGSINNYWNIGFDQANSTAETAIYDFSFYNLNSTSTSYKMFLGNSHRSNPSWRVSNHLSSGINSNGTLTSNAVTGIRFGNYNGTITKGKFVLYGLKGI